MKTLKLSITMLAASLIIAGVALAAPVPLGSISVTAPSRVAVDLQGNVYVTEPGLSTVLKFNGTGALIASFSVPYPLGIAVAANGTVYVGSRPGSSRIPTARVFAFSSDLSPLGPLGDATFATPADIAVDGNGRIYVVDKDASVVRVFESTGVEVAPIRGTGTNALRSPVGVAISDAAGEVYVTSAVLGSDQADVYCRVSVFDRNGGFIRSFGQYGTEVGRMSSISGIASDGAGTLYIADSGQNVIHMLNASDGTPVGEGGLYANAPLRPAGVAISKAKILYAAITGSNRIDRYGLDGYITLDVSPGSLSFEARQYEGNPEARLLTVSSSGTGTLAWSASSVQSWITLTNQTATSVTVGVNTASLVPATYYGQVIITSTSGFRSIVNVTLNLLPPGLWQISNQTINISLKKGRNRAEVPVTIGLTDSPGATWTAASDASWLSISPASGGDAPSTSIITVRSDGMVVRRDPYVGHITLTSPNAVTPARITVNLTITGTIRPRGTLSDGSPKIVNRNIAVARGIAAGNSSLIKVFKGNGAPVAFELTALNTSAGTSVAVGDFNGDGIAEIAVGAGNGPAVVTLYQLDKTELLHFTAGTATNGARVMAADLNGDGQSELLVESGGIVTAYIYDTTSSSMAPTGITIALQNSAIVAMAAVDLSGDGQPEIATASSNNVVQIWTLDTTGVQASTWTVVSSNELTAAGFSLAAADCDADGRDEIIIGTAGEHSMITIVSSDGSMSGFKAFDKYGVRLAAADIDGDGKVEILATPAPAAAAASKAAGKMEKRRDGQGVQIALDDDHEGGTVRVYGTNGTLKFILRPFADVKDAVNLAIGDLGF